MLLVFINVFLIFFNLIVAFICLGEIFLIVLYFAFPSWSLSRYILRFQVKERWFYFEKMKSTTTFHRFLLFPVSRTGCVLHVFCCIALNSSPFSGLSDDDHCWFGPELRGKQQLEFLAASWPVRNQAARRQGLCQPSIHLHYAQVSKLSQRFHAWARVGSQHPSEAARFCF